MKNFLLLLVVTIVFSINISFACSGFYIAQDSTILAGKNTDWTDWRSKIWFTPAGDSTFGYVCFGFKVPFLSDGMNDQGLIVYHFRGHEKPIRKSLDRPVYQGVLSEKVLAECTSIDDVKNMLSCNNLGFFNNGMIMFSDRFGNSIIVEGDTIVEKSNYYQVCTNTYPSEYSEEINPCSRYQTLRQQILAAPEITDDLCVNMLQSTRQEITQYSIVYDVKKLIFSVYLFQDYTNRVEFNLPQELSKGKQVYPLYTLFPKESSYYQVYIKRQSPQNNIFILLVLILCGGLYVFTLILWPPAHLLKIAECKENQQPKPKINIPKVWSFVICLLLSIYLGVLLNFQAAFQIGLPARIDNFPWFVRLAVHIPALVGVLLIPLLVMNIIVLRKKEWSKFAKWHFSLNTVSYLILTGLFFYWGLIKIYW